MAASAGVASVGGCLDGSRRPSTPSSGNGESTGARNTHQPGSDPYLRDVVYYDPDGDGDYENGQSALADVPSGGTFVIGSGTWDVAQEGRLLVEKTIDLRGNGWASKFEANQSGTRIVNTGSEAIDKPAVEFRGPSTSNAENPRIHPSMRNLRVDHEGDSPAVLLHGATRSLIADCYVNCRGKAPRGLVYGAWAFFARALRNKVTGATEECVHVGGNGYAHEFYSNHFATGAPDATAFLTTVPRTILVGGECASVGPNGTAIAFGGSRRGGYVVEPGIEATETGIHVGTGDGVPNRQVQLYHVTLPLEEGRVGVRFDNARGAQLINPVTNPGSNGGTLVEWTERAEDCGVTSASTAIVDQQFRDDGADNPWLSIHGGLTPAQRRALPTDVPITVDYYTETGTPIFNDGSEWKWAEPASLPPDA
jgi:hypothetical protein